MSKCREYGLGIYEFIEDVEETVPDEIMDAATRVELVDTINSRMTRPGREYKYYDESDRVIFTQYDDGDDGSVRTVTVTPEGAVLEESVAVSRQWR